VETLPCGRKDTLKHFVFRVPPQLREGSKPVMRFRKGAVNRVACLEWSWWIMVRCTSIGRYEDTKAVWNHLCKRG